jgi:hypothetical protein
LTPEGKMSTSNWEPFLAWEGIEGSIDKNGLENINVSYYVPTLLLARRFTPRI